MQNKKIRYTVIAALAVAVLAGAWYQISQYLKEQVPTTTEKVHNEAVGLGFSYQAGEAGLALFEPPLSGNLLSAYLLMPQSDFEDYQAADTEGREAPASIGVFVYALDAATTTESGERLDRITRLQNWAMDNSTLTSFNQAKNTPDIVEIDGAKALHYQADGLYQQDIYLVSYKNRVYMFVGQYNDVKDMTYTSFAPFMETVAFD